MKLAGVLALIIILGGCVTPTTSTTAVAPATVYTGEVWTWDEQLNTVTLRQGGQIVRVQVTPDQLIGLQLHQNVRIAGTLAPPLEIAHAIVPSGPVSIVPRGDADVAELSGTVQAVDGQGTLAITTPRGNLLVWGTGTGTTFKPGDAVRVRTRVQAVDRVPLAPGSTVVTTPDAVASPTTEPGEYAVVVGRIMGITPNGMLRVESPRGPVEVWVPTPERYRAANTVEVRTSVTPAR